MKKDPILSFISSDLDTKIFSVKNYNERRNAELKSYLEKVNLEKLDELDSLLNQCQLNKKDKDTLNILKTKIEIDNYNIKGILHSNKSKYSSINKYTDTFLDSKIYDINFEIYKITKKINNKVGYNKNIYNILLLNIKEDTKAILEKYFNNFRRPVLLFTNLEAILELDNFGRYYLIFKSTYKTKIYMEKNKIEDLQKSKLNFLPTGIYIDYLKSNEFSYINWINTQKLFLERNIKFKEYPIKTAFDIKFIVDLKTILEIDTQSLYLENLVNEFTHFYPLKNNNINLCCFVKNIYENKRKKIINVTLENLFDLNNIILEIPKNHEILENLQINCIYLFMNFVIFIDEKFNIKLTLQKKINEQSRIIFLYFLVDPEKYKNKKFNDLLFETKFSQLLPLVTENKIIRIIQKYSVNIDKINYINLYFSNDAQTISNYDGCLQCSDGTSSAFFIIKGKDISELKKLKININYYIKNNSDKKVTIYPPIDDIIQLIILGNPVMKQNKELSFLEIYENINELKESKDNYNEENNFIKFDLFLTKNEFTIINGTFNKKSEQLEAIPIIKVLNYITLDEYIYLLDINKNQNKGI